MIFRLLILSSLLALVGCSQTETANIRFGLASMPSNLDPRFATDAASSRIGRLLYQRLVDFNDAKQPVPDIANWQRIDPSWYRFVLNDTVQLFSDQTRLSASDVKATYEFILDKKNASPHRASLAMIEKIETPDVNTIDFHLNKPDPLFPGYLVVGILPEEKLHTNFDFAKQPIGSGSFEFLGKQEDKIHLQRKSDKMTVDFVYVPNPTVRVLKLLRGEIDIVQNDLQPELIGYLQQQKNIRIQKVKGSNFSYIGFNLQDPILSQHPIREAITLGINREEIIQYVFADSAKTALSILPPEHWAGNPAMKDFSYNPDKAKALLAKYGYSLQNPLRLSYKTSSDPFRLRLATIYQHQLKQIGVNLDIQSYDWGTFYGDIKNGRFQLYSLAWIGIKTPDIFRYTSHSKSVPPSGANRGYYANPEVDQLIEIAEAQQQLEQQSFYFAKLQQLLLDDLPYMPLWYEDNILITRQHIKNYSLAADGNFDGLITVKL